ncbi:unnamed protein product [Microthlaspi erraticum]|uniref:FBD domain-containing protein n=1 Tax=Microthlaspi erraticum TaxID=1685480 RepID=A0A6D2JZF8_9BRAS|nr:unnamed protein product [Microthlaspi erraticum]
MLARLLVIASTVHVASVILKRLLKQRASRRFVKKRSVKSYWTTGGEDRISMLPDDLLVRILTFVPLKRAVTTMVLSQRWRFIWTLLPQLSYKDIKDVPLPHRSFLRGLLDRLFGKSVQQRRRSIWRFLDESLQVHKAHVLEKLFIELGPRCPIDADVGKWIENAVERKVRVLVFMLTWSGDPTSLPKSLYTCDTLYYLTLSDKILVDVPSPVCLPSLQNLRLYSVVYKDEDSHVRFLSSCPVLRILVVERHHQDNVTHFRIKVPSLECLYYDYSEIEVSNGSLVIDSPTLKRVLIRVYSGDSCLIENKHCFDKAIIHVLCYPDVKFIKSLSSVMSLELILGVPTAAFCNAANFSRLIDCRIIILYELDWLEPLVLLLQNSPNLKVLFIHQLMYDYLEDLPLSWNQPSSVPGCLSTHLEIFEWKDYGGRSEEQQVARYIFANSKCLKRAGITMKSTCNMKDKKKMMKEIESMSRVSTSSQLLFSTQLKSLNLK